MNPTLLLFLVFLGACCGQVNQADIVEPRTPTEIHLAFHETQPNLNVMWATDATTMLGSEQSHVVQYGTSPGDYEYTAHSSEEFFKDKYPETYIHKAELLDLEWDTTYYYRVGSEAYGWSAERSLTTPHPPSLGRASLAIYGDMGIYHGAQEVRDLLKKYVGDLQAIVHLGDVTYAFENWWRISAWFAMMEPILAGVPYMVAQGNRDFDELSDRFTMPATGNKNSWYSWTLGSIFFVAIDTGKELSAESSQYQWLEPTLRSAAQSVTDAESPVQWILLYGHRPPYTSSAGHKGSNLDVREALEPLLSLYHVDLACWGDDHGFERTFPVTKGNPDTTNTHYFNK